jgi:small subunit ribosomal protein S9
VSTNSNEPHTWNELTPSEFSALVESGEPGRHLVGSEEAEEEDLKQLRARFRIATHARAVPVSASYFSRTPQFNDRFVNLEKLAKTYANLPLVPAADVERVAWLTLADLRLSLGEPVKATDYVRCLSIIKRLHQIHPQLKPAAVTEALEDFKRGVQAFLNVPTPITIDKFGRALGVGKRKSSTARAFVVEGDGQILINGKTLADYFGRVHDRESAVWALHATQRIDKYNVWARVEGGGTTGQAEALTLAISKALMAHEPALKPALRRGE